MAAAAAPMTSEVVVPTRVRLNTSRPYSSVPNQKSGPGGCSRLMMFISS